MRWFKHMTDSLDDPFMQDILDEFSYFGYFAWFGLIEIIAKENKNEITGKLSVNPIYLRRKLRASLKKLKEFFQYCQTKGKLSCDFSENIWNFDFPKIAEIKDNYTKDLQGACKGLAPYKEGEVDKKGDKTDPRIKVFIDYAFQSFKDLTGKSLCIDGGKDGQIIKKLLGTYGLDSLKGLWDSFLLSTDPFIEQAGRSIGVFKSQINKLLFTGKDGSKGKQSLKPPCTKCKSVVYSAMMDGICLDCRTGKNETKTVAS